ncbi:hypothetical protein ACWOAH_05595 [Vagococcus vulneris]|uniref:Lipoprotein n=1 Tax=Vagococcus vulneris TaxID=1977869 RepID=A0A429ZZD3_9ENTE|nr:hypothetical protein [Vagococcus vulneris]RST99361.1 hypothetical protein CBF37_05160 [Vagococcus vulneris]
MRKIGWLLVAVIVLTGCTSSKKAETSHVKLIDSEKLAKITDHTIEKNSSSSEKNADISITSDKADISITSDKNDTEIIKNYNALTTELKILLALSTVDSPWLKDTTSSLDQLEMTVKYNFVDNLMFTALNKSGEDATLLYKIGFSESDITPELGYELLVNGTTKKIETIEAVGNSKVKLFETYQKNKNFYDKSIGAIIPDPTLTIEYFNLQAATDK